MKIITVTHDGKINSEGFSGWDEARTFIASRIPEKAFIRTPNFNSDYWVRLEYVEEKDGKFGKVHTWELNEIDVRSLRSS